MSQGGGHDLLVGPGGHAYKKPGGVAGSTVASVTAGDSTITIAGTATDPTVALNQAAAPNWTGSHVWDQEDNGTTNVPTPVTLKHRNNAAGTPAAGYGVGEVFQLDSSTRQLRSAVEIDAVWSDATNAAEVSSLAIKTMLAGVLTESVRFGTGATVPDCDLSVSLGRVLFDSRSSDIAYFSHRDRTGTTDYALFQNANGAVRVNSASGQLLGLYSNNSLKLGVNTTGLGFFTAAGSPVAQPTVTGSKGANAALTSLMTALSSLGLVADSTT